MSCVDWQESGGSDESEAGVCDRGNRSDRCGDHDVVIGASCIRCRVRREQAGEVRGHRHAHAVDQSTRVASYGSEEARRHRGELGVRGRDTKRVVPARLHEGLAVARDEDHYRRLSGEGWIAARERTRYHVAGWEEAVHALVRGGGAITTEPVTC